MHVGHDTPSKGIAGTECKRSGVETGSRRLNSLRASRACFLNRSSRTACTRSERRESDGLKRRRKRYGRDDLRGGGIAQSIQSLDAVLGGAEGAGSVRVRTRTTASRS